MLLQKDGLQFVSVVSHEGKIVLIGTDSAGLLWYSVKQDGFEDSYLSTDPAKRTGWESWTQLDLPDEKDDTSVVAREQATLTRKVAPLQLVLRSVYRSKDLGAAAPVQLVSAQGHLYVFRQANSKTGTLLCDRFVLDGMTNRLGRKLEVRFKRSGKRYEPYDPGKKGALAADSLDFRDTDGKFFYEPTTELCLLQGIANGWFSVVRVETGEHDKYRWHIFSSDSKKVDIVSIRASDEGLFDVRDETVFDPAPTEGQLPIPRSIPGIIRRTLKVPGATITGGPAATTYDLQQERVVGSGPETQLLRTETRLMLGVPTSKGTATYSFAVATDGTLSEISSAGPASVLRSDQRDVLLPLDTLDQIKLVGATEPPPQGTIERMRLGTAASNAGGKIIISSAQAAGLHSGDTVEIRDTSHYNGLYSVTAADANTFTIEASFVDDEMGVWEKREASPSGLVLDGMVTAYEKTADGKLRVTARSHGLVNGDQVQIVGTAACDGTFPVTRIDNENFVISADWAAGEAINVRLEALKRRGLLLDGKDDHVDIPADAFPAGKEITICFWAYGDGSITKDATFLEAIDAKDKRVAYIGLPSSTGEVAFECGSGDLGCDRVAKAAQPADYKDGWAHFAFVKNAATSALTIYRNGSEWATGTGTRAVGQVKAVRLGALAAGNPKTKRYAGTVSDLAIYGRALSAEEIRNSMHIPLRGQEPGLWGYWRLGGVVEGEVRKVIDLSLGSRDAVVYGGASAGAVAFDRKLKDGKTLVVKYTNPELVAVAQRGTYIEDFEFRISLGGKSLSKTAVTKAEKGKPAFRLNYWGKRSRSSDEIIHFAPQPSTDPFQDVGDGWMRASCRFTIPNGIAMIRSFEIADVRGTWDRIEIRRNGMRLVSDAISESTCDDAPTLAPLADPAGTMDAKLDEIRTDEQGEVQLFAEKLALEAKLALLADAEFLKGERDLALQEVHALSLQAKAAESKYQEALNSPFNYACTIQMPGTGLFLHYEGGDGGKVVLYPVAHVFEFVPSGPNWAIKQRGTGAFMMPYPDNTIRHWIGAMAWVFQPSGDGYTIRDANSSRYMHCEGGTGKLILYSTGQVFTLNKTTPTNSNITDAKTAWDAKQKELDAAKERLDDLNKLLGANAGQRPDMEKRLQEIATALSALQAKLGAASAAYLDGVKSQQQGALSMPDLGKDGRGLVTRGALLGFVRPAGRLAMQETCEGNVQLSYIDGAGRMRLTCYDATADSRNAAFEQWVTDAGRACLIQRKLGSAASITTPVVLDDSWSIEAWVATPLPTWEWVTLAGTQDQKNATLAVLRGQGLGLRCEGRFFASGYRLDTAPAGWHHIAAIGKGTGKNATVSFYVDGEKVGSPVRPAFSAVSLDGLNDFVELQPASFALTSGVTVSFWVRTSAPGGQAAVLLDAIDAQSRCVLRISMPDRAGSVAFECGQDAAGVDRVALSTPPAQDPSGWTHWAFTKNASTGLMRIYRNGRMWARETGKKRPFAAVSKVAIGKAAAADQSFFLGDISELCMWNKELSATEVQNAVGCPVRTDDPYLIGCWQFDSSGDTAKAKDDSKLAKHGALQGGPTVLDIAPPAQLVIASLGAATGIDPTPPGPPPPPPREPARALVCDGIDDHVEIPAMNIDYAQGITLEAWVRYDQFKPFSRIIDFGNGAGVDNIVFYNNSTTNTLVLGVFRGNVPQFVNVANALELGKWLHLAGTIDAAGNAKIYKNGVLLASAACQLPSNVNRTQNYLGTTNWPDRAHLAGQMVEVRLWNKVRTQAEIQDSMGRQLAGTEPGLAGYWTFTSTGAMDLSPGKRSGIYTGNPALDTTNLPQLAAPPASVPVQDPSAPYRPLLPLSPSLKLSELRIWGTALSDDEMAVNSKTLLSGNEPGLLAYLPLNEATGSDVRDVTGRGHNGTIGTAIRWACAAPIGYVGGQRDGLVSAEYSSVTVDPATGRKTGIMRRFYGSATNGAVLVLPEQRIEELELAWIGNAQFAPTLLGYIEGAPPIPSENLTENPSYNGATSVELVTSKDVEYRWNRSEDIGAGMSLGAFVGYESEVMVGGGLGVESFSKAADVRAGVNFNLNLNKTWRAETNITNRSSNRMTDRLELRGTPELAPKFPQIGQRFIPKNVGYALVISGTADVFVTRLARSGKMVGYQVSPIEDIPPDVNTITFLLNPAYVMQGSLDGLTGSSATSDRFHKHVPAMRAQYGSLYPASYYRVKEAYALKQEIDADDKRRESFFAQFSTSGMASSMSDQIDSAAPPPDAESVQSGNDEAAQAEQKKAAVEQTEAAKKKRAEIDKQVQDPSRRAHAQTCWNAWQTKMERLQVLAGKRNIVNTYVWDADGGLRTEAQSFASTAEHTIGGSFSMDASLGLEFNVGAGAKVELNASANMNLTQSVNKTQSTSTGIELNVDLSGVEATGITDHNDRPVLPGEKVDRYRFMTFYLEGTTKNFNDFWSYVVDPEWLRGNGEEARALRQAMGKANKTWRVLHRVTYVERPALHGFGQDVRMVADQALDTADVVTRYLQSLTKNQLSLQAQLNDVMKILQGVRQKIGS